MLTALLSKWTENDLIPPGYFSGGLLQWGHMFGRATYVSKGIELRGLGDIQTLDDPALDVVIQRNLSMIALCQPGDAIKLHFMAEDDYVTGLDRYDATTADAEANGCPPWVALHRKMTSRQFRIMSENGQLCRDKTYLYLCHKADAIKEMGGKETLGRAREWLRQTERNLRFQLEQIARVYGCDPSGVMNDQEHCLHLRKWANPSLATYYSRGVPTCEDMNPDVSIAHNVLRTQSAPFLLDDDSVVLRHDGMYHSFIVFTSRPRATDINKTRNLLSAVNRGIHIAMTIYPLSPQSEIKKGQDLVVALRQSISSKQNNTESVNTQIGSVNARIQALSSGQVLPCNAFTCIHISAATPDLLAERTTAIKTALAAMDGLRYLSADHPETARRLYAEMCPGWAGSDYRGWDVYYESPNLADLMPISASFNGFFDNADALLLGNRNNIVGVRIYDHRNKTPQFTVNMGKTGSGKTADGINIVSQIAHLWCRKKNGKPSGFLAIFDEGLAWHTTAELLGLRTVILREGATPSVNPFDTYFLPRTGSVFTEIVAIALRLIGLSGQQDKDQTRKSLVEMYARRLSDDFADSFLEEDPKREQTLIRELIAVLDLKKKLREESDLLDAYVAWQELRETQPEECERRLAAVAVSEVNNYLTTPALRTLVRDYAYTRIDGQHPDFPQWKHLVGKFLYGKLPEHNKKLVSEGFYEELDMLGTYLNAGLAGGTLGNFLDGNTTLKIESPGIYVETSYLTEGSLLRAVAPMLILSRVRSYIVTRPRAELKAVYMEEFAKLAGIPGFDKSTKECLAQFRKYAVWFCTNFQAPSQIDEHNPALMNLLFGQSAQFWLHCMPGPEDVVRVAQSTPLPQTAQRAILGYPMIADQPTNDRASYMCLFAPTGNGTSMVGTTRNVFGPHLLYIADSSGDNFDSRQTAMREYPTAFDGVLAEVQKKLDAAKNKKKS